MALKKWSVVFISGDPFCGATVIFEAETVELINPKTGRMPYQGAPEETIGEGVLIDGKPFMCETGVTAIEEVK